MILRVFSNRKDSMTPLLLLLLSLLSPDILPALQPWALNTYVCFGHSVRGGSPELKGAQGGAWGCVGVRRHQPPKDAALSPDAGQRLTAWAKVPLPRLTAPTETPATRLTFSFPRRPSHRPSLASGDVSGVSASPEEAKTGTVSCAPLPPKQRKG